jgi:putative tricarboxylic transport membrane protein
MRINDALLGCILIVVAAVIAIVARGFPAVPGQDYGASAFPTLIAAGFAGCGLVLIRQGLKEKAPAVVWRAWTQDHRHVANVLLVVAATVFYIVVADWLGFMLTTAIILLVLLLRFRVHWATAVAVAVATPIVMQYLFGSFLLVPLPWGLLAPIRWG